MSVSDHSTGQSNHQPRKLGELIKEFTSRDGISEKLRSYEVVGEWEEIVGETIGKNTEILRIENGTLYIQAKNSAWRNELIFVKPAILKRIKERYPTSGVEDIFFV